MKKLDPFLFYFIFVEDGLAKTFDFLKNLVLEEKRSKEFQKKWYQWKTRPLSCKPADSSCLVLPEPFLQPSKKCGAIIDP